MDATQAHGVLGDPSWPLPRCVVRSTLQARPHYSDQSASEFLDEKAVLDAKVTLLVELLKLSRQTCVYTGAGLSTAAGVADYASKAKGSLVEKEGGTNRLKLKPTRSHRVLAGLEKRGLLQHWLQQNHDGLAQKAGFPFEKLNEIHGSWFDRNNPVVQMDGVLRPDLLEWMVQWTERADLVLAIGTSLCGMNADNVAMSCAERFTKERLGLGLVIVNLQTTPYDDMASLRIFAKIDDVMEKVAKTLRMRLDTEEHSPYPPPGMGRRRPLEKTAAAGHQVFSIPAPRRLADPEPPAAEAATEDGQQLAAPESAAD